MGASREAIRKTQVCGVYVYGPCKWNQPVQTWDHPHLLNLDDEGNCYLSGQRGTYVQADWYTELGNLEACLAALGSTLTTSYDEDFIAEKRKA